MYDDLRELYQEVILEHGKHPRNRRQPAGCNRHALGRNPVCGDAFVIYLTVDDDGVVRDCGFKGEGCAISMASASMMSEIVKGKTLDEARRLFETFHGMATGDGEAVDTDGLDEDDLDRLQALSGVRRFPIRVKCATLAWHTMQAAMDGVNEISTE
ncbi:MAG: SUF system NifU family Fe-S cluster assembly protein [Alphaproteobacteria bacterium]